MNHEGYKREHERAEGYPIAPPAVESFLDLAHAAEVWPDHVTKNEAFQNQVESRRQLNQRLQEVISRLPRPDLPLEEAVANGNIPEAEVAELYTSLQYLLEDEDYQRIALYLPFEFLPPKTWEPDSPALQQATEEFRQAYSRAWEKLLSVHDVRANFVDGDVLDVESRAGDLPRVVKAAHLIPKLVERNLMTTQEVVELLESSDDETLQQSIADTLPVLADLGLLHEAELKAMHASSNAFVRNVTLEISIPSEHSEKQETTTASTLSPSALQETIQNAFKQIDAETYTGMTKKREAWLTREKKRKILETLGDALQTAIANGALNQHTLEEYFDPKASVESQQAAINGIRKAIEAITRTNPQAAQVLFERYQDTLTALWHTAAPAVHEELEKTFFRLHGLQLITTSELEALDISVPALAGPFSKNLSELKAEVQDTQNIVAAIEANPELSQKLYPVVLLFGSRLKGYGANGADVDTGVFVRPGVAPSEHEKLQKQLKETFTQNHLQGDVVAFWLEETKGGLGVQDFNSPEVSLGESSWTHILFGAAWEGNASEIRELREKLLTPYMYDTQKTLHGREARGLYIEELERDTLQYRLMHKGYERFFPAHGGIQTPHADRIDGQSTFWDSGYRQLATQLYANRVFLPKIK
ncbi:MAG: hypothetical protein WCV85_00755 [Patescibacteria group bacterium]|jgi:hypothetical protein